MSSLPTGCYGDDAPLRRPCRRTTVGLATSARIRDKRTMNKPYEIIRRRITKIDDKFAEVPAHPPADMRTWSGFAAFIPGDVITIKGAIGKVRISFPETVLPAEGGAWVYAGYNDLEMIVKSLRGF